MKILIKLVLFFLSIFPNWFLAQNLKFKEMELDGTKIKLDNLNWKYGSISRDFLISDTTAFYKLFCKVEDENPNYRIPSSSELLSLYNGEAYVPSRNVSCPKSFTCMQTSSDFGKLIRIASSEKNLLFPLAVDLDLWKEIYIGENKINHPHKCENCSFYTKKQRENFPCNVCKNTKETYCNETINCPICKGTGIRKSKSKTVKLKDFYLKSKEDVHYIYFDSPTDFGIYDLKNEKKIKFDYLVDSINFLLHDGSGKKIKNILIEFEERKTEDKINLEKITEFLRNGSLSEARNIINKLNFPNKQIRNEYDYLVLTKSENSISSGNYFEGIGFAELMFYPENFTIKKSIWDQIPESTLVDLYKETSAEIKNKIKVYLSNYFNDKYKNVEENYPVEQTNRFIEDNKELLKKLSLSNHEVLINRNGELFIDNQLRQETPYDYDAEFKYGSLIMKKDFFGFDVLINGTMKIEITESQYKKIAPGDSIHYLVSEKYKNKDLYISRKGDLYLGRFGAPFSAQVSRKPSFYSDEISGNQVQIEQLYQFSRIANGIKIDEGKDYYLEKTIAAKKGTGRKIFRILTSPIWGPFYLYYKASQ
jgi:hypothetical protein